MIERFRDRKQAGQLLAKRLVAYSDRPDVLVLGLPRGGVPVAYEIAQALQAPLDVFVVRKLGVPGYEELAMGAVSMGGAQVIDPDVVEEFRLSQAEIESVVQAEVKEMGRRERAYRGERPPLDARRRTVILVDDGIATGSTMRAAIAAIRRMEPAHIVVAVGVAPLSTYLLLGPEADEVVCLTTPREFRAVSVFYDSFPQLTDDDVRHLLDSATRPSARSMASA